MAHIADKIAELRQPNRPEGKTWDRGWYDAITAATHVARHSTDEPDPLRELAEWLASLRPVIGIRRTALTAPDEQLNEAIERARAALGKEG